MADKPGVPEQLGQRGEEARRRQFQRLAVEMALRRMADENRILRTGQADIEQAPLFRERLAKMLGEKAEDSIVKFGAILATAILDAGQPLVSFISS